MPRTGFRRRARRQGPRGARPARRRQSPPIESNLGVRRQRDVQRIAQELRRELGPVAQENQQRLVREGRHGRAPPRSHVTPSSARPARLLSREGTTNSCGAARARATFRSPSGKARGLGRADRKTPMAVRRRVRRLRMVRPQAAPAQVARPVRARPQALAHAGVGSTGRDDSARSRPRAANQHRVLVDSPHPAGLSCILRCRQLDGESRATCGWPTRTPSGSGSRMPRSAIA